MGEAAWITATNPPLVKKLARESEFQRDSGHDDGGYGLGASRHDHVPRRGHVSVPSC